MSDIILPIISNNQNNRKIDIPNQQKSKTKSKVKIRKPRSDKLFPRKFPVTEETRKEIRKRFIIHKRAFRNESLTITEFNTMLLRFGLRNLNILTDEFQYVDTRDYKTVKPNDLEKSFISGIDGLVDEWGVSERKAIHHIICSVLEYLKSNEVMAYEEVQPFKLS
ncbi:hypothetical protein [Chengkuizengella axinellae]|uniref:DUF1670 domain-containing protein n=1 Tax=Chengkuizengella axinellae TaxID=3064388 RepID=A0ABT9J3B3_9BACL|nr:hypothetical protein [Chengkuizengella sp. 2205SS18-9]MDP5276101.1 hypothetical protein [Chengkuizengella sp. 2205SS18-9]